MIINGLGFTGTPLYMTPQYFEDKPIAQLLGKEIISTIELNQLEVIDDNYSYLEEATIMM